ncbi:MAG: hypothetical protein AAGG00_04300 [Cyanobacteria bacterium P01_H01_bin.150]
MYTRLTLQAALQSSRSSQSILDLWSLNSVRSSRVSPLEDRTSAELSP